MEAGRSAARTARARHRHELRMLTYVTLDQANGGIVRNLSHDGIAVQAVAAVRPRQQLRVRFELRYPRLRVETRGEVVWSTFSGQCGIRFIDLSPRQIRQIDEWIFGDLLEGLSIPGERTGSVYVDAASSIAAKSPGLIPLPNMSRSAGPTARVLEEASRADMAATSERQRSAVAKVAETEELEVEESGVVEEVAESDGLILSSAPVKVIELHSLAEPSLAPIAGAHPDISIIPKSTRGELDWLSQPLSSRGLAWTVNTLVVIAAVLLFAFVFLSVTREAPRWPLVMTTGAAIVVGSLYWGFFKVFGGSSLGTRLARLVGSPNPEMEEAESARFR